jgi:uncharacterized protein YbaP (TraB family)
LEDLSAAYRRGDEATLTKAVFDPAEMKKHPAMFDMIYHQRNKRWVPRIHQHLAGERVFVAVGAGHLVGKKSVVTLLRTKGLKVERVGGHKDEQQ